MWFLPRKTASAGPSIPPAAAAFLLCTLALTTMALIRWQDFFLLPSWPDHYRVVVWPDFFRSLTFLLVLITVPCLGCWLILRAGKGNELIGLASLSPLLVTPYFFWHLLPDGFPANFLFYGTAAVAATLVFLFLRPGKTPSPARPLPRISRGLLLLWTLCLVLFFWFGGLYFGHWAGDSNGDSGHFILQAKSLHQDHDLDIANNFTPQERRLLKKLGPSIMHISPNSRNGHSYSWHGFGLALLLAPFLPLGSSGLHLVTACLAALAALGTLIASLLLGARRTTGFTLVTLFLLSAFWGLYAFQILPECGGAAGMIWLLVALLLPPQRWRSSLAITTMVCVLLPWLYVRYAPPAAIGAMFFLYKLQRDDLAPALRKKITALFLLCCFLGGALFFAVHLSMFRGGLPAPLGSDQLFTYFPGMWKILLSNRGICTVLPVFPLLLFSPLWCFVRCRNDRLPALMTTAALASVLLTSCTFPSWDGGAVLAGRFLVVVTPLFVPFLVKLYDDKASPLLAWIILFFCVVAIELLVLTMNDLAMIRNHFSSPFTSLSFYNQLLEGLSTPWLSNSPVFGLVFFILCGVLVFVPSSRKRAKRLTAGLLALLFLLFNRSSTDFTHHPWRRTVLNSSMRLRNSRLFQPIDTRKSLVLAPASLKPYPVNAVFADLIGGAERIIDGPGPRTLCLATGQREESPGRLIATQEKTVYYATMVSPSRRDPIDTDLQTCESLLLKTSQEIRSVPDEAMTPFRGSRLALFPVAIPFMKQARLRPPSSGTTRLTIRSTVFHPLSRKVVSTTHPRQRRLPPKRAERP